MATVKMFLQMILTDQRYQVLNKVNPILKMSALSMAISNDHDDVAIELIEAGANSFNDANRDESPIFTCVDKKKMEILEYMMEDSYAGLTFKNSKG